MGNVDQYQLMQIEPVSTATQTALVKIEMLLEKATNNESVATLDANSKIQLLGLPPTGALVYKGTWDASSDTPCPLMLQAKMVGSIK